MGYSVHASIPPSGAELGAPAFADMFSDAVLLDSAGADMTSLILGIENDLSAECQQHQEQAGSSSWSSLLPAQSATLHLDYSVRLPAAKCIAAGAWHSSLCMIPNDQAAAAAPANAAVSLCHTGPDCTAARDGSFMQLMQDATTTPAVPVPQHVDIPAAAAIVPCSTLTSGRRNSLADASSGILQCTSPGTSSSPNACSTRGCSAGLLSGSEDSSQQCGLGAPAALAGADLAVRSSGGAAAGTDAAAAAAAGSGQAKRKAANLAHQRKLRQKRQEDADCTKEQISSLNSKNTELQEKVDALRADNARFLNRLADVTSKWQATVVENARLNQEHGRVTAQLVQLQQQLAMAQQEVHFLRQTKHQQEPSTHHQTRCMHPHQQHHAPVMHFADRQQQQHKRGPLDGSAWATGQW